MTTETKCVVAELVAESLLGGAIGIGLTKFVYPKCDAAEKVVMTLGASIGGWMLGRAFAKQFYRMCDNTFDDVDFEPVIEQL